MLQPKKRKYRKEFRRRSALHWKAKWWTLLNFWSFWVKAISPSEITARQIEAARKAITNHLKRQWKLWIRIFPHKPITRKAAEVPMGSWKWSVEFYVAPTHSWVMLFELEWVSEEMAKAAFNKAIYKLPCKTRFVTKESIVWNL